LFDNVGPCKKGMEGSYCTSSSRGRKGPERESPKKFKSRGNAENADYAAAVGRDPGGGGTACKGLGICWQEEASSTPDVGRLWGTIPSYPLEGSSVGGDGKSTMVRPNVHSRYKLYLDSQGGVHEIVKRSGVLKKKDRTRLNLGRASSKKKF